MIKLTKTEKDGKKTDLVFTLVQDSTESVSLEINGMTVAQFIYFGDTEDTLDMFTNFIRAYPELNMRIRDNKIKRKK